MHLPSVAAASCKSAGMKSLPGQSAGHDHGNSIIINGLLIKGALSCHGLYWFVVSLDEPGLSTREPEQATTQANLLLVT